LVKTGKHKENSPQAEKENVDPATVLIISDDAEFSRSVTSFWQTQPETPAFTLMSGDVCRNLDAEQFEVAVVGSVQAKALVPVLQALELAGNPVLLVSERDGFAARESQPGLIVVRQHQGWMESLVLVAKEALRHRAALMRAHRAEMANLALQRQAALGRHMLEERHSLNNALTSVLGNSELLLLDPGMLPPASSSQVETIRNMALRIHEILQRFSSLEKELSVLEKQAEQDKRAKSQVAAAGM
jgi:signal transduction histidine kinase